MKRGVQLRGMGGLWSPNQVPDDTPRVIACMTQGNKVYIAFGLPERNASGTPVFDLTIDNTGCLHTLYDGGNTLAAQVWHFWLKVDNLGSVDVTILTDGMVWFDQIEAESRDEEMGINFDQLRRLVFVSNVTVGPCPLRDTFTPQQLAIASEIELGFLSQFGQGHSPIFGPEKEAE